MKKLFALILVSVLLTSCSSDDKEATSYLDGDIETVKQGLIGEWYTTIEEPLKSTEVWYKFNGLQRSSKYDLYAPYESASTYNLMVENGIYSIYVEQGVWKLVELTNKRMIAILPSGQELVLTRIG